ncbi:AAA family ATPase [Thiolapillus sp.]|uniref:AAA family ATPase n=1 Tax=Thiolapillus sp. TaxID=2017437 RepID=UPI0025EC90DC|nr:DUF3696 domain-containing protein [Thiolapillus sp.]
MIIKALTLENFKGIAEPVRIEFKPITLLFGPNSAGKSTVLQALVYTREILERHNLDPDRTLLGGEWMDLGGFDSLIHGHDRSRQMVIGFELDVHNTDLPDYLHEGDSWLLESAEGGGHFPEDWLSRIDSIAFSMVICWSQLLERPLVESVQIDANGSRVAELSSSQDGKDITIELLDVAHAIFSDEEGGDEEPTSWFTGLLEDALHEQRTRDWPKADLPLGGQQDALPEPAKGLNLDRSVWGSGYGVYANHPLAFQLLITSVLSGLIAGPVDLVRRELDKLIYIGPLREVPSRHPAYRRSPDVSRWARGTAAWDVLHNADAAFVEKVNDWLTGDGKLDSGYAVTQHRYRELALDHPVTLAIEQGLMLDEEDLSELFQTLPVHTRVAIRDMKADLEVFPQDIGVGISQVIPIIVGAIWQRSGILAVEQPELHIHPALQVALGDLFASELENSEGICLLETHSEHLMLRFLRRIRETAEGDLPFGAPELKPEQVGVIYVQSTGQGVELTPLPISEEGEFLQRWPKGFFEERAEELF